LDNIDLYIILIVSDMQNERVAELLVETGAYKDLAEPVILTSGQLGIFYVNTEKLLGDPNINDRLKEFENNPQGMISYAVRRALDDARVSEAIGIIAGEVQAIADQRGYEDFAVSGGQRRDWIFSGPVAKLLERDHVALFKSGGRADVFVPGKPLLMEADYLGPGIYDGIIHVADLLTEGSSCYRMEDGKEMGWIPMLRERGANIQDLVGVVTRLQGGEKNLRARGVEPHTLVTIDGNFLAAHSSTPTRAICYSHSPDAWSKDYLMKNGALAFVDAFSPEGGKQDRAMKFARRYGETLKEADKWDELRDAVKGRFDYDLEAA